MLQAKAHQKTVKKAQYYTSATRLEIKPTNTGKVWHQFQLTFEFPKCCQSSWYYRFKFQYPLGINALRIKFDRPKSDQNTFLGLNT